MELNIESGIVTLRASSIVISKSSSIFVVLKNLLLKNVFLLISMEVTYFIVGVEMSETNLLHCLCSSVVLFIARRKHC